MSFGGRGRGRGRAIPIARHDIQLAEDEQVSDVPLTFPKPPLGSMPPKAKNVDLTAEQQRLLVRRGSCVEPSLLCRARSHKQPLCRSGSQKSGMHTAAALSTRNQVMSATRIR